jgi:hypothetical protein
VPVGPTSLPFASPSFLQIIYLKPFPLRSGRRRRRRSQLALGSKGKAANNQRNTERERGACESRERGGRRRWSRRRRARLTAPLRCASAGFAMTRRTSGAPPWSRPAPAPAPSRYVLCAMRLHACASIDRWALVFCSPPSAPFCDVSRIQSLRLVVTSHLNDVFLAPAVCSQGMRAEMVRREGQHHLRDLPSGLSN